MNKINYTNLDSMIENIKKFTKDNCSYVEAYDDYASLNPSHGWFCPKTETYFYMSVSKFQSQHSKMEYRYLDSFLKRKIASIYLSNCKNDKEYDSFKNKINKMKAFW